LQEARPLAEKTWGIRDVSTAVQSEDAIVAPH
jgi:hypothetical protein